MARLTITGDGIEGSAELELRLKQIGTEMATKIIQAACRKAASVVRGKVIEEAPDGPDEQGAMKGKEGPHDKIKNSVKVKKGHSSLPDAATNMVGVGKAFHALFLEFGTVHMPPHPFMSRAFAESKDGALAMMGQWTARGLDRVARTGSSGMTASDGGIDL